MGLISSVRQSYLDGKKARSIKDDRNSLVGGYGRLLHIFPPTPENIDNDLVQKMSTEMYQKVAEEQSKKQQNSGKSSEADNGKDEKNDNVVDADYKVEDEGKPKNKNKNKKK